MSLIIKKCPQLMDAYFGDGRNEKEVCGLCVNDEKCRDKEDCVMKQVANNLLTVVRAQLCNNCDGCGYFFGCQDKECGTYQANKCLELLGVEYEVENEKR